MALLANDAAGPGLRVRQLIITPPGAAGAGHEPSAGTSRNLTAALIQIPTGQTKPALEVRTAGGTLLFQIDHAGNLGSQVANVVRQVTQVTLTAAQIITLHSVPVVLVAAPGAGVALVLDWFLFQFKYGTVQMTGGGVVNPVYHGATTNLAAGSVAAATVQAAANYTGFSPGAAGATALAITTNTGIDLLAGTADFAAGDSTAIATVGYSIVTLG